MTFEDNTFLKFVLFLVLLFVSLKVIVIVKIADRCFFFDMIIGHALDITNNLL